MSEDAEFIKHYPPGSRLKGWAYEKWLSLGITKALKQRRMRFMDGLLDGALSRPGKILEVGCGSGRDFVKFMKDSPAEVYGLDPFDAGIRQPNFTFVQGDMISIPYPDHHFDAVLSIGVMEHIEPFEKLSLGIKEMVRVSKRYCMIVPSIATRFDPHFWEYRWQLKKANDYQLHLHYLSDAAWLNFEGFRGGKIQRYDYIPGLITCLMIYGEA
jgi:ubiquinone/menaquinone biosynthesis C-methylase UbiE